MKTKKATDSTESMCFMNLAHATKCAIVMLIVSVFLSMGQGQANTFHYDYSKRPSLLMPDAYKIAEGIIEKKNIKGAYVVSSVLNGLEKGEGGVWTFSFARDGKESVQVSVLFPEDKCVLIYEKEGDGPIIENMKRDGSPFPSKE